MAYHLIFIGVYLATMGSQLNTKFTSEINKAINNYFIKAEFTSSTFSK